MRSSSKTTLPCSCTSWLLPLNATTQPPSMRVFMAASIATGIRHVKTGSRPGEIDKLLGLPYCSLDLTRLGRRHHETTQRRRAQFFAPVRDRGVPWADSHPERLQRRVHAGAANAEAAPRGSTDQGAGRLTRQEAGPEPPAIPGDGVGDGGGLRGDERGIRPALRRHP